MDSRGTECTAGAFSVDMTILFTGVAMSVTPAETLFFMTEKDLN